MSTREQLPRKGALGPGDYAFLGFVARGPATAYQIKKAMAGSISFFWTAAHSQVYSQAARLVRDGYLSERDVPGARRARTLALTPRGRRALQRWLREPAGGVELRDEMLIKVFFASLAEPHETQEVLNAQRAHYEEVLANFARIQSTLDPTDDATRNALLTLRLGIKITETYLTWLTEAAKTFAPVRRARVRD